MVWSSEQCSSLWALPREALPCTCSLFGVHCAAWTHMCSGAMWSGGKALNRGEKKKKALASVMGLENSCIALWPPDNLGLLFSWGCFVVWLQGCLPSRLTCRKLKILVDVIFYWLQFFVGITWTCWEDNKPLLPAPTLWAFRKPRQDEGSWKPCARDRAAVNCTVQVNEKRVMTVLS